LILVGAMMARACTDINWRYAGDSVPAFLTMAIMPFTYSIAYGLIAGIISYIVLNTLAWVLAKVSGGRIVPYDYEQKDYWTYKVRGGLLPGWVKRAAKGKRDFWRDWEHDGEVLTSPEGYAMSVRKERESGMSTDGTMPMQVVVTEDRVWEH
jgi:AGZA family xanthine/uracil permease-like MFS transporter